MSLRNDIIRFSVLGFRSDIRIERQAPVVNLELFACWKTFRGFCCLFIYLFFFKINGRSGSTHSNWLLFMNSSVFELFDNNYDQAYAVDIYTYLANPYKEAVYLFCLNISLLSFSVCVNRDDAGETVR